MPNTSYEYDKKYLNQMFVDALNAGDTVKCAQAGALYIKLRMREAPFCRKILPPKEISKADCQRDEEHDTLYMLKDIAPEAEAVSLTFRGKPNHKYIQGKRFKIGMYKIASPKYTKNEDELLAYEMPITALIEEDIIKMMQKEEDKNFMLQCRDIVGRPGGKNIEITTSTGKIDKNALTALTNQLDGDELETACFLMSKTTWNDWACQGSDVFDVGAWDVAKFGYKEEVILGRKCYITLKEDLIPNNEVWAFTSPEYLGEMYTLDQAKFWVNSEADEIFFKGWEKVGCGIGNTRAIARLGIH